MQKQLILLSVLFLTVFISACGGGSDSTKATTIYDAPKATEPVPADGQMGGAVQGLTFAKFSNYSVSTFAGKAGAAGSTIDDLSTARFNKPVGIATDGAYLYVADTANNRIRRIKISDNTVDNLAGSGLAGYANSADTDTTGINATFNAPSAITVAGKYLYVTDTGNNMIRRVHKESGKTNLYAGSATGEAGAVDSRTVPGDVRFYEPTGITSDGVNLYVADSGNHTIRRIVISPTSTAGEVTTLAGSPGAPGSADGKLSDDRTSSDARFNQPARLTTDGANLYVTDALNRTIRRIAITTGTVVTIAGVSGPIDVNGNIADADSGDKARFYQPNGITTDGTNLYLTDSYNNSVRMIKTPSGSPTSGPVTTLIPGTVATPGSSDGSGTAAKFDTPIGITTDGNALFVTDSHNHTIRKIESR